MRRLKPRVRNDLPKVSRVFYKPSQALCWSFSVWFPDQPVTWELIRKASSPKPDICFLLKGRKLRDPRAQRVSVLLILLVMPIVLLFTRLVLFTEPK